MERRGRWIWRDRGTALNATFGQIDAKADANVFVHFRRALTLDAVPATAATRVSADGRYRLYVNGAYVGRGPARSEPLFQCYDEYDIARLLRPGRNVIAALVHSYGRDMSWYEMPRTRWSRALGNGGFFFECDGIDADSDGRWRHAVAAAWERDTPAGSVGYVEIHDARKALEGWERVEHGDGGWPPAVVLEAPGFAHSGAIEPFPRMVARDIPQLLEERRAAVRVLAPVEVPADGDMLTMAESAGGALGGCRAEGIERVAGGGAAMLYLAAGRALSFVVDFGRDVSGYPCIELDAPAGVTVDVSYGETLRADGRCPVQRANPITSQNVHRYVTSDGRQAWEKFERAGFRYLQLTLAPPAGEGARVTVHGADVNFTSYPVGARGAFACSDEALTRTWEAGRYTLQLCMQDGYEDCPSREQRQWVGDAYVESLVNAAAFGDGRLTARLIRQVAQSQMRDGMTQMATPSDMSARWPLYIVDYCLHWLLTAREHVAETGDATIGEEILPAVARAAAWFEGHLGGDGLLVDPPGWIFIDWAEVDKRGACTALNALLVMGLEAAAELAERAGAPGYGARWRATGGRVAAALNEKLWDEGRGVYVDALVGGAPGRRVSQHANAALIAAGVAPEARWQRMLDYVMDPERLAATSTGMAPDESLAIDEERQVVLAQPFFMHFVHRALARAGRAAGIVENIRRRWAPMLEDDGTGTLWEHWHGRESRCHAWSATPVYDLSREVLGVRRTGDGWSTFTVAPAPADLTWARGVYPSARGDIAVAWERTGGQFVVEVEVPEGATCDVALPPGMTAAAAGRRERMDSVERAIAGPFATGRHRIEARAE